VKREPASYEFRHVADVPRARAALVETCARMHARGYIVAGDGNVSVKIGDDRLLVTPSGTRKGFMRPEQMVLCDLSGRPLRGETGRPSSELAMHVAVYEERPDARAVVHAHPPVAVAHTIAGASLAEPLMPEAFCILGHVLTIPYTTPTTHQVPDALRQPVRTHHALLLERHGSLTFGETLAEAYDRLEVLEHTAKISMIARVLSPSGQIRGLDEGQIDQLRMFLGCGLGS
jgi:L-fuculose-phosphate aldolase